VAYDLLQVTSQILDLLVIEAELRQLRHMNDRLASDAHG
jgi:hypothetical protein